MKRPLSETERYLTAFAIVGIDQIASAAPLTALVFAFVLIFRPQWFTDFVWSLYDHQPGEKR